MGRKRASGLALAAVLAVAATGAAQGRVRSAPGHHSVDRCLNLEELNSAAMISGDHPGALRAEVLQSAVAKVQRFGCPSRGRTIIAVVDFTLPSSQSRLWLVDLMTGAGLAEPIFVAHGKGSDPDDDGLAQDFSNINDSLMSSLGIFRGGEPYHGKHGLSLKIDGLEPSNSLARGRDLAIHTSARTWPDYVSPSYLAQYGRLGLSDGCFVVMQADYQRVHATLQRGGLLVAVGPIAPAAAPRPILQKTLNPS